jgi:hypothetical protein
MKAFGILTLLLFLVTPAFAADEDCHDVACYERKSRRLQQARELESRTEQNDQTWQRAVAVCNDVVRANEPGFDAHVPTSGTVRFIGSTRGRYAFEKCMAAAGQPIK